MKHAVTADRPPSRVVLWVVAALLIASTVSWRRSLHHADGIDAAVAATGGLAVMAVVVAGAHATLVPRRYLRSIAALWFVIAFVTVTVFGALHSGTDLGPSAVLATRLLAISIACLQLLLVFRATAVLRALTTCVGIVVAAAAVTGLVAPVRAALAGHTVTHAVAHVIGSRSLAGGIPPLGSTELGELAGFVVIGLGWLLVQGRARVRGVAGIVVFTGIVYVTGSRAGLVALAAAVALILLLARRLPMGVVIGIYASVPALIWLAFGTSAVTRLLGRSGSLSSRRTAWDAALQEHHGFWPVWFGTGLSPASLDSSWLAALVQGGLLAVVALAAWLLYGLRVALRSPWPLRMHAGALTVYVVLLGFLGGGLPGATPAYLVFFVVCVGCGGLTMARRDSLIEAELLPPRRRGIAAPAEDLVDA